MEGLNDAALIRVAEVFKALAEPRRLKLLNVLRDGERNVSELVQLTASTQANVSKHLSVLLQAGLILREPRGTAAYYRMANASTYQLCDIVCGQLVKQAETTLALQQLLQQGQLPADGN
ncbi:winged helix-turn-helix transcriptional regulator [Permianibacter sp. IMCC34836]|uniref:ArsR/SmtB family transcription factor n=1 Tax=Permianibacter fluminis TaxID=2738515 RepID=UPI00155748CC|nr:metalloregulator ArsR/SmtB family transcription factor [Permianibacter fluminis]NQD36334.1 winged helix-turn-helix transcriptional regulator [Permianibacter fluminis]